jgi:rRNA maturation protein Nop10
MEAYTTKCDLCGQKAVIHSAQYHYDRDLQAPSTDGHARLVNMELNIECPKCGRRTQIQHEPVS